MARTEYAHIELRDGVPWIAGTQIKVVEIAMDRHYGGWSGPTIQENDPSLSLGQIYSALAYYFDHKNEMDRDIEARAQKADRIRASLPEPPSLADLRAMRRRA